VNQALSLLFKVVVEIAIELSPMAEILVRRGATAPPTFTENCRIFGNFDRKEGQKQYFRVQMFFFVRNLKVLSEI
jgi:hypothetical protein